MENRPSLDTIFNTPTAQSAPNRPSLQDIFTGKAQIPTTTPEVASSSDNPLSNLGKTYSDFPSKFASDVQSGTEDIQKGDVGKGIIKSGLRTAGDTAEAVYAPIGAVVQTGVEAAKKAFPEGTGVIKGGIDALAGQISDIPAVQEFAMKHPNAGEDFNRVLNVILGSLDKGTIEPSTALERTKGQINSTVKTTGDFVNDITTKAKSTAENVNNTALNNEIIDRYQKAVKPTIAGKKTIGQADQYNQKVINAIKTVNDNKANLEFTGEDGETIKGRNPESRKELADAIAQTKKNIFEQYDAMANKAGEKGASVDLKPIASELDSVITSKSLKLTNPNAIDYAQNLKERLIAEGSIDTKTTQEVIQHYNKSLEAFYKNPNYDTASQAAIDAMLANKLRGSLDTVIENSEGSGYQDLKSKYGALKTIESDVVKSSLRGARQNAKGLIDFTDILSGGELVKGLLTLSPEPIAKGATMKAIATYIKYLNNPDRGIAKMFEAVEGSTKVSPTPTTPPKKVVSPSSENTVPQTTPKSNISYKNGDIVSFKDLPGEFRVVKQEGDTVTALNTKTGDRITLNKSQAVKKGNPSI